MAHLISPCYPVTQGQEGPYSHDSDYSKPDEDRVADGAQDDGCEAHSGRLALTQCADRLGDGRWVAGILQDLRNVLAADAALLGGERDTQSLFEVPQCDRGQFADPLFRPCGDSKNSHRTAQAGACLVAERLGDVLDRLAGFKAGAKIGFRDDGGSAHGSVPSGQVVAQAIQVGVKALHIHRERTNKEAQAGHADAQNGDEHGDEGVVIHGSALGLGGLGGDLGGTRLAHFADERRQLQRVIGRVRHIAGLPPRQSRLRDPRASRDLRLGQPPLAQALDQVGGRAHTPMLCEIAYEVYSPSHYLTMHSSAGMKPYELIAALMALEGGSLPLAKKMGNEKMQSKLYKFAHNQVAKPAPDTAMALANFFGIPLAAIYDEKAATAIATERGISALPAQIKSARATPAEKTAEEKDVEKFAAAYRKLSQTERQRLRLLMLAAVEGKRPAENWRAPNRPSQDPRDMFEGGDSGLAGLDEIQPTPREKKEGHK